ncbi:MAG TPA: glycoside hydrolase family 44 protein, partial [Tepidisphaeraceae bacterium]
MSRSSFLALGGACLLVARAAVGDVTATVNGTSNVKPISPYIYGSNQRNVLATVYRDGGNRWTAFNWENNASNAGSDYQYQNDNYLVRNASTANQNKPGYAVLPALQSAAAAGRASILTIPIAGYASADKLGGGDVRTADNSHLSTRFNRVLPAKPGGNFSLTPDLTDDFVYQDEFVNWVNANKAPGQVVMYNLDNEPDLWSHTHAEIHPARVTYAELVQKNIDYAKAIKNVSPDAVVLGAVNYGWGGYRSLQGAPDANGRDFQTHYLQQMKLADAAAGKRLVDVMDFHWYPEAQGTNASGVATRIDGSDTSPGVAAARIQAPRSLWDPNYQENSWITRDSLQGTDKKIRLLPRTQALIDAHNPGMKMAITEYNYGGGDHISGGLAQADALGAFGEAGLQSANHWDTGNGTSFVNAAMRMYQNYDGKGGKFGDTSVAAAVSNDGTASLYAALDSTKSGRLTLVLINKSETAQTASLSLANLPGFTGGEVYQFEAGSTVVNGVVQITRLADLALSNPNALSFSMDPLSVTTIVLVPEPAGLSMIGALALASRRNR